MLKYRSLFASLALLFECVDFVDGVSKSGEVREECFAGRRVVLLSREPRDPDLLPAPGHPGEEGAQPP